MHLIDMTLPIGATEYAKVQVNDCVTAQKTIETHIWHLQQDKVKYDARVHWFHHWGMSGTYIDLPGHIVETDDGKRADNLPLECLYRLPATRIQLDKASGAGRISADELASAAENNPAPGGALVLNALGRKQFDQISERSVYLGRDAVEWLLQFDIKLFISDVYESNQSPQGVFSLFFAAGICTICNPINLWQLPSNSFFITALPLRFADATQLPCRLLAEIEER